VAKDCIGRGGSESMRRTGVDAVEDCIRRGEPETRQRRCNELAMGESPSMMSPQQRVPGHGD
jgi:hypothetical protein